MMKYHRIFVVAMIVAFCSTLQTANALVEPGDTFSFDITGFTSKDAGYLVTPDETATFGATTTFTAAGINGQNITITSSEAIASPSVTQTTDTFTISTPTNFLTTTTVNGATITQLQFDLGDSNSGLTIGGANTVDYLMPLVALTATGSVTYGTSNTVATLSAYSILSTLSNGNMSLAALEVVNDGATAISNVAVHSFTYAVTYNTVAPEPSAALLATTCAVVCLTRPKRRLQRAKRAGHRAALTTP